MLRMAQRNAHTPEASSPSYGPLEMLNTGILKLNAAVIDTNRHHTTLSSPAGFRYT
jgi:hypothetical protein